MAGEVHAHGLVARENESEACANQECRNKEGDGRVAECENKVGNYIQRHAGADQVNQVTAVDESPGHDAVHDQTCSDERVEPAGTADAEFLGVEGDVVGYGAVGEPDENKVDELRNGVRQEESVER